MFCFQFILWFFQMDGSSSCLTFLLTVFHCYTADLSHYDAAGLQILSLLQLDFLHILMPLLNYLKVWVGAFMHSLQQHMRKPKHLIFMPRYCYTHRSSFQGHAKIAGKYTLVWQPAAGCSGKRGDLLVKWSKEQQRIAEQRGVNNFANKL